MSRGLFSSRERPASDRKRFPCRDLLWPSHCEEPPNLSFFLSPLPSTFSSLSLIEFPSQRDFAESEECVLHCEWSGDRVRTARFGLRLLGQLLFFIILSLVCSLFSPLSILLLTMCDLSLEDSTYNSSLTYIEPAARWKKREP